VIRREVDSPMSRLLLEGRVHRGQHLRVGVRDNARHFDVPAGESNIVQEEPLSSGRT
jgi:hypothetical protein